MQAEILDLVTGLRFPPDSDAFRHALHNLMIMHTEAGQVAGLQAEAAGYSRAVHGLCRALRRKGGYAAVEASLPKGWLYRETPDGAVLHTA